MTFEKLCHEGALKLQLAEGNKPPRPEQHSLVCQWPWFELDDELLGGWIMNDTLPEKFEFRPRGLLLFGDTSTGKTTSAWCAIKASFLEWNSGCSVPDIITWRAAELGRAITDAARGGEGELDALVRKLQRCALLYVDDLDKARFSPTVQSQLFDVLEYRELHSLPVIITTNCTGAELAEKFDRTIGGPIVMRLVRMSMTVGAWSERRRLYWLIMTRGLKFLQTAVAASPCSGRWKNVSAAELPGIQAATPEI